MKEGEKDKKWTTACSPVRELFQELALQLPLTSHCTPLAAREGRNYSHLVGLPDAWTKTRVCPKEK